MAMIEVLKSKLHGAAVTEANLHYQGSIGIDADLIREGRLREFEKVMIANIDNGARFETYVMRCDPGSRIMSLNGAAARLVEPGHRIIVFSWAMLNDEELRGHRPRIILLDENNTITRIKSEEIHAPVEIDSNWSV